MLAFSSSAGARLPRATLAAFLALSRVHSDGWGYASTSASAPGITVTTGLSDAVAGISAVAAEQTTTALCYLRLASTGSAVNTANLQPFRAGGVAFMHNGALVPRERGFDTLTTEEGQELQGTSDSEIYFALVRRSLTEGRGTVRRRVADGVARTRDLYPDACLNAVMLVGSSLVVIAARGTVAPPLAALSSRGMVLSSTEAAEYNTLYSTTSSGTTVVASAGVGTVGWAALPDGEVMVF